MNKNSKKNEVKLVRNTELPVPKTKLIISDGANKEKKEKVTKIQKLKPSTSRPNFDTPELNTALHIAKKIDLVEKTKNLKLDNKEVAFCEKVTRKINFPIDKPIYKDLIPLQVPSKSPPILTSREPLPQKDKEPQLSTYAKLPEPKEYIYKPSITPQTAPNLVEMNNLRLYKIMQRNTQ